METVHRIENQNMGLTTTLWFCVGTPAPSFDNVASWREIPVGQVRKAGNAHLQAEQLQTVVETVYFLARVP
jgi:hypothetical protein